MENFIVVSENNTRTIVQALNKECAKQKVMKQLNLHWSQILYITK